MPEGAANSFQLVSVAVGQPVVIGTNRQGDVVSGIRKHHVTTPVVHVGRTNIAGDGQADLVNHGGLDKAVYCYPRQHRAFWAEEIGYERPQAPFGENLSTLGPDEQTTCIGDLWQWGTAVLQVSQPRWPCYKLALHSGHIDMVKRFVAAGLSGWYLRVVEEGEAPTEGTITLLEQDPLGISVAMAFVARRDRDDSDLLAKVFAHPDLADSWRD